MPFRSVTVEGTALMCFPPADRTFQTVTERTFRSLSERVPAALQAALADLYPRALVQPRVDLASLGPGESAWYVYRDGRFSPFTDERWWEDGRHPWIVIAPDGRYVDGNDAALTLLNVTRDQLLSSRTGDYTTDRFRAVVPWVWKLLEETRELHSVSIVKPRGGGPERPVEFHMQLDVPEPGFTLSVMREVPREAVEIGDGAAEPVQG